jgi:mRNA interferase RelE/StbE
LAVREKLVEKIDGLGQQPRPVGCQKLAGDSDLWRFRWNDYRVVYQIEDAVLHVLVVKVAHRREVYRGL